MRDVILARADAGVETWNPEGGNFKTLLPAPVLGNVIPIKRGWTSGRRQRPRQHVRSSFVNTHLEAFHPMIRAAQASELVTPPGPATGPLPVVLVGDLNSDDDTVTGADRCAYQRAARRAAWSSAAPTNRSAAASKRASSVKGTAAAKATSTTRSTT